MGPAKTDISTDSEKWTILKLSVFAVLICDVSTWTYHIVDNKVVKNEARQKCQADYTDMVFIRNKKESEYLNKTLPGAPYYWIGIKKENNTWIWEKNKEAIPEDMQMWAHGEPSKHSKEICVELYIKRGNDSGKWNNIGCFQSRRPLCYQDSCNNSTCNHHGECIEDVGNYTCECWPGFYGNNCEHAVSCVNLQIPANGKINCVDEYGKFQYKSFCIFSCNNGYTLNGWQSLFCQNTGEWSEPTPSCLAVSCAAPPIPENGNISCTANDGKHQYQSYCNFSCEDGYELNGPKSVFCQETGQWTQPTPLCLAVSCGDLQIPANGKMDCVDEYGKFQYKSFCIFSCNKGYTLHGIKSLFCQNTGEWSEPTPTCSAARCADPQIPDNGKINCTDKDGKHQYKSYCNFSCNDGYELNGTKSIFCQETGQWSEPTPICLAVSCRDLQIPANGKMDCVDEYGKFQYRSFCIFSCNEGYTLNGIKSVFCQNTREWSELTPTCLAVSCTDLQIPDNGKINCADEHGKFQYKSFCNFSCNEGYELNGTKSVVCLNTGEWSESTPTCLAWNVSFGKQKQVTIVSSVLGTVGLSLPGIAIMYVLKNLHRKKKERSLILETRKDPSNTFENPAFEDKEIDSSYL